MHNALEKMTVHEVEPAEAEEDRRRLMVPMGRLERRLVRSRNPITTTPSISFSDTFGRVQE